MDISISPTRSEKKTFAGRKRENGQLGFFFKKGENTYNRLISSSCQLGIQSKHAETEEFRCEIIFGNKINNEGSNYLIHLFQE